MREQLCSSAAPAVVELCLATLGAADGGAASLRCLAAWAKGSILPWPTLAPAMDASIGATRAATELAPLQAGCDLLVAAAEADWEGDRSATSFGGARHLSAALALRPTFEAASAQAAHAAGSPHGAAPVDVAAALAGLYGSIGSCHLRRDTGERGGDAPPPAATAPEFAPLLELMLGALAHPSPEVVLPAAQFWARDAHLGDASVLCSHAAATRPLVAALVAACEFSPAFEARADLWDGYIEKKTFYNVYPRVPRGLYINHSREFLEDVNVRMGLQHATNWQKVIDIDLRGDAGRLNIYNEGYGKFSNSGIQAREYSPEKAREAFAKAGFTKQGNDGVLQNAKGERLSFSITHTASPVVGKMLQRLKEEALKAGLEYRLEGMDGTASYEKVMQKKHDLTFWGWGTQPPFPRYFEGIHSSNAYDPGTKTPRVMTNNISVYANSEADPLAQGIRFATSEKDIRDMSWKLEKILHDTAFWIPGYKRESYRLGHWRWMQWPEDFNVKMTREAQESYVYWIDVEEQAKTLRARNRDETYPEVDQVYDQYRVK